MSYVYGKRATAAIEALVREIREELYPREYGEVQWDEYCGRCCELDVYVKRPHMQRLG